MLNYSSHHLTKIGWRVHTCAWLPVLQRTVGAEGFMRQRSPVQQSFSPLCLGPQVQSLSILPCCWGKAGYHPAEDRVQLKRGSGLWLLLRRAFTELLFLVTPVPQHRCQFLHLLELPGFLSGPFLDFFTGLHFFRLPEIVPECPSVFQVPKCCCCCLFFSFFLFFPCAFVQWLSHHF